MSATSSRRKNQRQRTRKDLLSAAGRLLRAGRKPTMDEVAEEALVSRATAYRYFPNIEALLVEAPLDEAVPDPDVIFRNDDSTDPFQRLDRAESQLHDMCCRFDKPLRAMLAASLDQSLNSDDRSIPIRQNRRGPLIEAALAPVRNQLSRAEFERLSAALSLIFGTESMIVFSDVLGLDARSAKNVKRWAIRALVDAALNKKPAPNTRVRNRR